MRTAFGILCMIVASLFIFAETEHFGGNMIPETKEEWLCDVVGLLLFLSGNFFIRITTKSK